MRGTDARAVGSQHVLTVAEHGFAGVLCEGTRVSGGAVIFVGGAGSTPEEEVGAASFLAQAGFTTLVLGFYGWEGTPPQLEEVPVEYVERAVRYLREVRGVTRIIMVGVSEGAVYTLLAATLLGDVDAVCAVTPLDYVMTSPSSKGPVRAVFTWRGEAVPFVPFSLAEQGAFTLLKGALTRSGYGPRRIIRYACDQAHPPADAFLRVEDMQANLLLIAPSFDDVWASEQAVARIERRLREHGYPYPVQTELYQDASHLMGGSYDLSGVGMWLFKRLLYAECHHPRACETARQQCLERIRSFCAAEVERAAAPQGSALGSRSSCGALSAF